MDPAFTLGAAAPAAGAHILVLGGPAGAGHASDRAKAGCYERMRRQAGAFEDQLDRLARNVGKRIELEPRRIRLNDGNAGAQAALEPLAAVDPCRERRQGTR